jgi:hypothetical protein
MINRRHVFTRLSAVPAVGDAPPVTFTRADAPTRFLRSWMQARQIIAYRIENGRLIFVREPGVYNGYARPHDDD